MCDLVVMVGYFLLVVCIDVCMCDGKCDVCIVVDLGK